MNICKITWSSGKSCEYEVEDLEAFKVSFFGGRGVIPDDVVFEVLDSEELGGCKQLPHHEDEDDGESEESSQVTGDDEDDVGEEAPEASEDEGSVEVVEGGDSVEVVKEEAPAPASKKKSKR